jgi:hypothetical protein
MNLASAFARFFEGRARSIISGAHPPQYTSSFECRRTHNPPHRSQYFSSIFTAFPVFIAV